MPTTLILYAAIAAGNWQCEKLSGLWECRAPSAVASSTGTAAVQQTSSRDARQQEFTPDTTAKSPREPEPEGEPLPHTEPVPSVAAEPEPAAASLEPEPIAAPLPQAGEEAYVVQVGAFRSEASARREAQRIADQRLVIMPTRRDDEDWYILVLGAWPSWQEADAVGQAFEEQTRGSYWVRKASALQRVLRTERAPD